MVQTLRAQILSRDANPGPATEAIEEAMRLLPDDPRPKLVASHIFTFAGAPQRAADLWMEASRQAPELARMGDRYVMSALAERLIEIGDRTRADRISSRLGEIGFSASLAPDRSASALARTRQAVRDQNGSEALTSVTAIADPDDLLKLYIDRRYAALWPRISEWAGSDLAAQSLRYLQELRSDWIAADDFRTAVPYALRLSKLRDHSAVVQLFLPMFDRIRPDAREEGAERLAPIVARSLAVLGRVREAQVLLDKTAASMPANDGNALNIDGAYITLATLQVDWPQVITRSDLFLNRARLFGKSINQAGIVQDQAWRACALWQTGRQGDAQQATVEVLAGAALFPGPAMSLHICRGDKDAGRKLLLARLADENTREWALHYIQPESTDAATPLENLMKPTEQAVRTSPDVISAANEVGRILPHPVDDAMPAGFDPFRAKITTKPVDPGAI